MTDGPRTRAEKERQLREKRAFMSIAGVAFGASLLAAIMVGHRRAHRQALAEGEGINRGQVNWGLRAFGIGTLYAVASVGMIAAAGSYYLQSTKTVSSMEGFSQLMRTKAKEKLGGFWMRKMLDIDDVKDQEAADKIDRMVSEFDEKTGERKIKFARVKNLMSKGSVGEEYEEEVREPEKLSVGGRMRAAFGFGKKVNKD